MRKIQMNEKIEDLLYHSGLTAQGCWDELGTYEQEAIEKFAELIVKECYETIKKDMELADIQLIPIDFGIYANGRLRRIIKEHFGVEE
jgi:hypothetical protein